MQGIQLPDGSMLRDMMFVEDTLLYLQGTKQNIEKVHEVLQQNRQALEAKINWNKSFAIWPSNDPREWFWEKDLGLKWLRKGETTRYLGFPVKIFRCPNRTRIKKSYNRLDRN